jgi:adenylate cyclase
MVDAYLVPDLAPLNRHRLGALTSIGRHPENSIEVPDPSVSKFHAQIQRSPEGPHILQDLGSRNGTYVSGQRIQQHRLVDGQEVVLGTVRFRYRAERAGQASVTLSFKVGDLLREIGTTGAGVTILGPTDGSGTVALHQGDSAIEHSNTHSFSHERFVPVDRIPDMESLKRDYEKLRIAHELSASLRFDAPVDELLTQITARSFDLIAADRCAILLMAPDGVSLVPRVVMERGGGEPAEAMALSQTVLNEVLTHKKAVLATDAITDERFHAAQSIVALSMRSVMCVPLIYEDEIFGVMHVDSLHKAHAFSPKDLQLLQQVANKASAALKNASLLQQIEHEAETRARLGRLLSPNLVEQVVNGQLDLAQGGERRHAAVMFTDIRGFTSMSEQMDAADVTQMLNEYFDVMVDVLFQHHGTLDKYMGDAIMALFGVPKAFDGYIADAVRCALRMQQALRSLNRKRETQGEQRIEIGIGLNCGDVIWGPLGSRKTMDYTVIGDVVNVASRLCSRARGGELIVSEAICRQVEADFFLEELEPASLKGKALQVRIWRLTGERAS